MRPQAPTTLRFFHGLGGTGKDGDFLRELGFPLRIAAPSVPQSFHEAANGLALLDRPTLEEIWIGYSMGGRFLMAAAARRQEKGIPVPPLVILSAGWGESDPKAREARLQSDEAWALRAEEMSAPAFWELWYQQPLFSGFMSVGAERRSQWLEGRSPLSTVAWQLRHWGPGNHGDLSASLRGLIKGGIPVLYIAGEKDEKYRRISAEIQAWGAPVALIQGASHLLPLEAPELVVGQVKKFIEETQNGKKHR